MAGSFSVENATTGSLLGTEVRLARSLVDRTVGLLLTPSLPVGHGLWIERAPSIHMFFMRFPIDAVFVDGDGRIVRIVADLKPWRLIPWVRGARDCLELGAGTVAAHGASVGDRLMLVPSEVAPEGAT